MTDLPASQRRPRYDQTLKRLLLRAHDGFLALITPGLIWRGERSPELPDQPRQADLVWDVERSTGWRGILHIELQTKADTDIGERLADYAVRLWRRDHLALKVVVVFLREAPHTPATPFVIPGDEQDTVTLNYTAIRLWEVPQEQILSQPDYQLWPLSGPMAGATVESTVATAERIAAAPASREERGELTAMLATLAGIRLPLRAVLDAMRRNGMIDDLLQESGMAQILIEEGRERGVAEGKAEGLTEGMRQMARVALEGRFAPLGDDLLVALGAADEAALRDLMAHITTDTLAQTRARLGLS